MIQDGVEFEQLCCLLSTGRGRLRCHTPNKQLSELRDEKNASALRISAGPPSRFIAMDGMQVHVRDEGSRDDAARSCSSTAAVSTAPAAWCRTGHRGPWHQPVDTALIRLVQDEVTYQNWQAQSSAHSSQFHAKAAQTAGAITTRFTAPSSPTRHRHQTDDRITPGAETRQVKQPNPQTAGFAASQRVEKRRQKHRPSRWMPISTGTATSS